MDPTIRGMTRKYYEQEEKEKKRDEEEGFVGNSVDVPASEWYAN
jgi:hypothetical protein